MSSYLHLDPSNCLFPLGFPTKALYAALLSFTLCFTHLILHDWITQIIQLRTTDHTARHYAVFSTPLLPRLSSVQIASSAPYSRKFSACVLPQYQTTKKVENI